MRFPKTLGLLGMHHNATNATSHAWHRPPTTLLHPAWRSIPATGPLASTAPAPLRNVHLPPLDVI